MGRSNEVFDGLLLIIQLFEFSILRPNQESNFRASMYEAISSFVSSSAKDCFPTVEKLTMAVLERLSRSINEQVNWF